MSFKFSSFIVDVDEYTLKNNEQNIEIEPKIFLLLCYFCENAGRAISRQELIEEVWQGRIVSHAAINRAISELRKIVEQDAKSPIFITTVSKVGYQFNAEITFIASPDSNTSAKVIEPIDQYKKIGTFVSIVVVIIFIFYIVWVNSKKELEIKYKGENELPVSTMKGSAFKPQISSEGQVLFLHRNQEQKNVQISVRGTDGVTKRITNDNFYYLYAVFRDETRLLASRFDNLNDRACEVVEIDLLEKTTKFIFQCADRAVTHLAYDKLTNKLFYNSRIDVSSPFTIHSMHLDTKRIQQLTFVSPQGNNRGDFRFSLSSGGEFLAVLEYQQNSDAQLKIVDVNQPTNIKRLANIKRADSLTWLSNSLMLISDKEGFLAINIDENIENRLVSNKNITQAMADSESGKVVFVKFDSMRNVNQVALDPSGSVVPLTNSVYQNTRPSFATHSNSIVYLSTDDGDYQVYLRKDNGGITNLKFPERVNNYSNLVWAKNDELILATINSSLYSYDFKNGKWRRLNSNLANIHYVTALDQNNVIVSSDVSGDWQLWQLNIASLESKQLTNTGGYSAHLDGQSKKLYYTKFSEAGLYSYDLSSGEELVVLNEFKITNWNKWQIHDQSIYYWGEGSMEKFGLKTGKISKLAHITSGYNQHFTLNHNGKYYSYSQIESEKASVWQNDYAIEVKK